MTAKADALRWASSASGSSGTSGLSGSGAPPSPLSSAEVGASTGPRASGGTSTTSASAVSSPGASTVRWSSSVTQAENSAGAATLTSRVSPDDWLASVSAPMA